MQRRHFVQGLAAASLLPSLSASPVSVVAQQSAKLPAWPKRIACLEFPLAESLLALGLKPAGLSEAEGYQHWIGYGSVEGCQNLGSRQQPALEQLALLQPDLILGVDYRHAALFKALDQIAPTILYRYQPGFSGQSQLDDSLLMFEHIAQLTDRQSQAAPLLQQFEQQLQQSRQQLAAKGLANRRFLLLQDLGMTNDSYWLYTANSMAAGLATRLGLSFWPPEPHRDAVRYLYSKELLTDPAHYILFSSLSGPEIGLDQKLTSAVWQQIPAWREQRIVLIPRNIWSFGGLMSAQRLAEAISQSLLELS